MIQLKILLEDTK